MFYVYRLQSIEQPEQEYTGFTSEISKRLASHNAGQVLYTSKYKPWKLVNFFAFGDEKKAKEFEFYLKSGSGRAFAKKHF
jgi:predicted GIY-YIG superfamily endonuclease